MVVLAVLARGYNTSTARPYWRRPQNSSTIRVMLFDFFNLCVLAGTGQARRVPRHPQGLILTEGSSSGRGASELGQQAGVMRPVLRRRR